MSDQFKPSGTVTKKEVALVITTIMLFAAVLRLAEKKIDSAHASSTQYTDVKLRAVHEFAASGIIGVKEQISVERNQRQEDIRGINGKLDTITSLLISIKRKGL